MMVIVTTGPFRRSILGCLLGLGIVFGMQAARGRAMASEPVGLIFDTDICGDVDDVLALAMIHSLESRGECRLLAVTVSVDHEQAAPFVDAVNTFYGRGEIPIGVVGEGGVVEQGKYLVLADQKDNGRLRYPHKLTSGASAPKSTEVLRKALASQPDGSVVIVQVGFSTNLAKLLDTPADDISPLPGEELVRRKVRLLSLMAGAFEPINGKAKHLEYNIVRDVPSARALAERWPSPMVFSGFEIGIAVPYPSVSIERDYRYVTHHPVAEAYVLYNPPPHNRPTWDLTSVLYAIRPDRGYFEVSAPGKVTIDSDGSTQFTPSTGGAHRYLILKPERRDQVTEALVLLSSQPPSQSRTEK
jgi:inosine-uridine nucleoside N-ribohydrolase